MSRCDWIGPVCSSVQEPDRLVGWDDIDGIRTAIIEPGASLVVRSGCSRRARHRGRHGPKIYRRVVRRARRIAQAFR